MRWTVKTQGRGTPEDMTCSGAYSVSEHATQEMSFQGHSSSGLLGVGE